MSHNLFSVNAKTPDASGTVSLGVVDVVAATPQDNKVLGYSSGSFGYLDMPSPPAHRQSVIGRYNTVHGNSASLDFTSTYWAYMWRGDQSSIEVGSLVVNYALSPPTPIEALDWRMSITIPAGTYLIRANIAARAGTGFDAQFRAVLSPNSNGTSAVEYGSQMRIASGGRYGVHTIFKVTTTTTQYLFFKYLSGTAQLPLPRQVDTVYISIQNI